MRFSNTYTLTSIVEGGYFLRKKSLGGIGFGVQQLENRYSRKNKHAARVGTQLHAITPNYTLRAVGPTAGGSSTMLGCGKIPIC
jgi:hypothetical protein